MRARSDDCLVTDRCERADDVVVQASRRERRWNQTFYLLLEHHHQLVG